MKRNKIQKGKVKFSVPGHYWLAADNVNNFDIHIPQIEAIFLSGMRETMFL